MGYRRRNRVGEGSPQRELCRVTLSELLKRAAPCVFRALVTEEVPSLVEALLLFHLTSSNDRIVGKEWRRAPGFDAAVNRLTREFIRKFCRPDGQVLWHALGAELGLSQFGLGR